MIRWIFFDIGNVIMNDDGAMAFLYAELHRAMKQRGSGVSFDELLVEREAVIAATGGGHWSVLAEKYLGPKGHEALGISSADFLRTHYLDYHNVLPGMESALRELSRSYSLAVVANQMSVARAALEDSGLRDLFEFLVLSEDVGLAKPDPAIYRWALMRADCQPSEVLMVGDRIDNDIVPARALGLQTIWFNAPHKEKGLPPGDEYREPYLASQCRRSTASIGPSSPEGVPEATAHSAVDLLQQVRRLAAAS